jgi:hypothetical protein
MELRDFNKVYTIQYYCIKTSNTYNIFMNGINLNLTKYNKNV